MNKTKPDAVEADAGEDQRNRKMYLRRLADDGVPLKPIVPQLKPVRQFQIAHLAATLANGSQSPSGPSECAAKALQFWNASGRALFVEAQAGVLVNGLFCLHRQDWESHGKALIASLDDVDGAMPGQNPSDVIRLSYESAQKRAGSAVSQVWKSGPRNGAALRGLFPATSETEESRGKKFIGLLQAAKTLIEACESLAWRAKDSNRLKACILHAWEPLGIWNEEVFQKGLDQAQELLDDPDRAWANSIVAFYPFVARWFAVMRQEQQIHAKERHGRSR